MKLILIKPVPKLGQAGDIVEASAGYARNFLLAKGLAREASSGALHDLKVYKQKKKREQTGRQERKQKLRHGLEGETILIRATANTEGHLFGGIDRPMIARAIAKRKKIEIDLKQLDLPHHLKTLGTHAVVLQLGGGETITFNVDIQREEDQHA